MSTDLRFFPNIEKFSSKRLSTRGYKRPKVVTSQNAKQKGQKDEGDGTDVHNTEAEMKRTT